MIRKIIYLGIIVLLVGCDFDYPLTGDVQPIDTTLVGEWRSIKGNETIKVRATKDGYNLTYVTKEKTILFNKTNILKIDNRYFLQAYCLSKAKHRWLVVSFKREGDRVTVRRPSLNFTNLKFKNSKEFQTVFESVSASNDFFGDPIIYQKVSSLEVKQNDFSNWSVNQDKDLLTDKITYLAFVKSSTGTKATLQLECDRNKRIEVWFRWPIPLEDLFPPGVLNADGVKIVIRADNGDSFETVFIPAKNWKDVVSLPPDEVDFWKIGIGFASITNPSFGRLVLNYANILPGLIARSEKLIARAYGRGGNIMTAEFDLNGSDRVVRHLKKKCYD